MGLHQLTLDFETYYCTKTKYSLGHMTPEEYIRDPRFQIILLSLKFDDQPTFWITGTHDYLRHKLSQIDWSKIVAVGHNMIGFDSLILSEVLGFRPARWQCTLSMGRALHGSKSKSLDALAQHYLLPPKGKEVTEANGKMQEDFSPYELAQYGAYCVHDTDLCYALYNIMRPQMAKTELQHVHLFTRLFAEPLLKIDVDGLQHYRQQLDVQKQNLLNQCGADQKQLRSDARFAELLQGFGVEPGTKVNKNDLEKYAFAKTDPFMEELQDHPDERVRMLAEARLKTKTSIEETRTQRLIDVGFRGPLPVLLHYGKTLTHRASGGGGLNLQNLPQSKDVSKATLPGALLHTTAGLRHHQSYDEASGVVTTEEGDTLPDDSVHVYGLRDGLMAPPGKVIVAADSSNIELRAAHLLAGQMDTIERIREGEDPYCEFAGDLYDRPITKADFKERQHGKVGMLQLQFKSGAGSLQKAARTMGGIHLGWDEAQTTVDLFRYKFPMLPQAWTRNQKAILDMAYGRERYIDDWGLCYTKHNAVVLPNGLELQYTNLRQEYTEDFGWQWQYDDKETRKPKGLHGGSLFANQVQALARIVVFDQGLQVEKLISNRYNEGVCLSAHDEVVGVVDENRAESILESMLDILKTPPFWWPQLPLNAAGGIGKSYGEAK